MALIFLGVLIVFTVSSLGFQRVRLPWRHRQWWVAPIHPATVHWSISFGGNVEVLSQVSTEAKNGLPV